MKKIIFLLLVFFALPVAAQTAYKCGSTYSQTPCGENSKAISVTPALKPSAESVEGMRERWKKESAEREERWKKESAERENAAQEAQRRRTSAEKQQAEADQELQRQAQIAGNVKEPSAQVLLKNKEACIALIKAKLKDPYSAQFSDVSRLRSALVGYDSATGRKFPAIAYSTTVNAKNSFGAYIGDKPFICYFDLKEERILGLLSPS